MSKGVEEFERMITEQDRVEALRINEIFDEQRAVSGHDEALETAIRQTEDEFTEDVDTKLPGKEIFGYAAAKNARRWWMYSAAYLFDLEQEGPDRRVSEGQIINYGKEKDHAGEQLVKLDPVYFRIFDLLERERLRLHLNSRTEVNHPFDMARDCGALVLSGALNAVFDKGGGTHIPDAYARALTFRGPDAVYLIEKTPDKRAKSYIISELEGGGWQQGFAEAQSVYIVDGSRDPLGQPFVMRIRGGQPAVAACKILDLANIVTDYKENLENAAFEHAASILAGRRAAESQD
jgi:hypothetical protein